MTNPVSGGVPEPAETISANSAWAIENEKALAAAYAVAFDKWRTVPDGYHASFRAMVRTAIHAYMAALGGVPEQGLRERVIYLLQDHIDNHRDPFSQSYNDCDKPSEECAWCAKAKEAIAALERPRPLDLPRVDENGCYTLPDGSCAGCPHCPHHSPRPALPSLDEQMTARIAALEAKNDARDKSNEKGPALPAPEPPPPTKPETFYVIERVQNGGNWWWNGCDEWNRFDGSRNIMPPWTQNIHEAAYFPSKEVAFAVWRLLMDAKLIPGVPDTLVGEHRWMSGAWREEVGAALPAEPQGISGASLPGLDCVAPLYVPKYRPSTEEEKRAARTVVPAEHAPPEPNSDGEQPIWKALSVGLTSAMEAGRLMETMNDSSESIAAYNAAIERWIAVRDTIIRLYRERGSRPALAGSPDESAEEYERRTGRSLD